MRVGEVVRAGLFGVGELEVFLVTGAALPLPALTAVAEPDPSCVSKGGGFATAASMIALLTSGDMDGAGISLGVLVARAASRSGRSRVAISAAATTTAVTSAPSPAHIQRRERPTTALLSIAPLLACSVLTRPTPRGAGA